jgi:membrane protein YqaA with SNARE-associated domain
LGWSADLLAARERITPAPCNGRGTATLIPWYLGGLSFAESEFSFFPIPPDVMLAPMSLAQPRRAWLFALITTVASVAGGLFGYLIGCTLLTSSNR